MQIFLYFVCLRLWFTPRMSGVRVPHRPPAFAFPAAPKKSTAGRPVEAKRRLARQTAKAVRRSLGEGGLHVSVLLILLSSPSLFRLRRKSLRLAGQLKRSGDWPDRRRRLSAVALAKADCRSQFCYVLHLHLALPQRTDACLLPSVALIKLVSPCTILVLYVDNGDTFVWIIQSGCGLHE